MVSLREYLVQCLRFSYLVSQNIAGILWYFWWKSRIISKISLSFRVTLLSKDSCALSWLLCRPLVPDDLVSFKVSHVQVIVRSPTNQHREYSALVALSPGMSVYNAIYEASVKLDNRFAENNPLDFRLELLHDRDCYVIGDISGSGRSSSHVWVITVLDRNKKVSLYSYTV